jgi:hypothetical protein
MDIRGKHVAFLASFHNPSVIFEQVGAPLRVQHYYVVGQDLPEGTRIQR